MARSHRPVRSRVTGKPTFFKEKGLLTFENIAPEPPTLETNTSTKTTIEPEQAEPWYKREARNRGTRNNNNAGIINDSINGIEDRLEEASKGIGGPERQEG